MSRRCPIAVAHTPHRFWDGAVLSYCPEPKCECPPCPGRGNDGHGMTHCAECCWGAGVEADRDCPVHGERGDAA